MSNLQGQLEALSEEELMLLCDKFSLTRPTTKAEAVQLLMGNCAGCTEKALGIGSITVTYIGVRRNGHAKATLAEKPCLGCGK